MKNSPTLCQQFIAAILSPIQERFENVLIYHYMDDILIAAESKRTAQKVKQQVIQAVSTKGLKIAEEKIQETPPWKYLEWKISEQNIQPQSVTLRTEIKILNDLQKLLGTIKTDSILF